MGQRHVNELLTHELIHSYDDCRAHVDWNNLQHVACSEVRAATLSGECFFSMENFVHLKFGWKKHHQVKGGHICVQKASIHFDCIAIEMCTLQSSHVTEDFE